MIPAIVTTNYGFIALYDRPRLWGRGCPILGDGLPSGRIIQSKCTLAKRDQSTTRFSEPPVYFGEK